MNICDIKTLISNLNFNQKTTYYSIEKIINSIAIRSENVISSCLWSQDSYTRNAIARTSQYELLLLCWQQGQASPIHNHGGQDCWMYVIDGKLEESQYQLIYKCGDLSLIDSCQSILTSGKSCYINDRIAMHSIQCISDRAISLHLYVHPIEKYHIFDLETNQLKLQTLNLISENNPSQVFNFHLPEVTK